MTSPTKIEDPNQLLEIAEKKYNKLSTSYSHLTKSPVKFENHEYDGIIHRFEDSLNRERHAVDAHLLKLTTSFTRFLHEARTKAFKNLDEQQRIFQDNINYLKHNLANSSQPGAGLPDFTAQDIKSEVEKSPELKNSNYLADKMVQISTSQKQVDAQTRDKAFQKKLIQKVKEAPNILKRKNHDGLQKFTDQVEHSIQSAVKNFQPKGIKPFSLKKGPSADLDVKLRNYFNEGVTPILHYFAPDSKVVKVVTLPNAPGVEKPKAEVIELDIDFNIPPYHGSHVLPDGRMILMGGIVDGKTGSVKTYEYVHGSKTLTRKANMNVGRFGFATCYSRGKLFVAGGISSNGVTATAEYYDVANDKWVQIADVRAATAHSSLAAFDGNFIYKLGGYNPDQSLNTSIERYSLKDNSWTTLVPSGKQPSLPLFPLGTSAQINSSQIVFVGGIQENRQGSNSSFVLNVEQTVDDSGEIGHFVSDVNGINIPRNDGFWNSQVVAANGRLFTLQNSTDAQGKVGGRRCLCFDTDKEWKVLLL